MNIKNIKGDKVRLKILILIFLVSFYGCSNHGKEVRLTTDLNLYELKWFLKKGKGVIKGRAFLITGHGRINCKNQEVKLIPASEYAKERMLWLYKSTQEGFRRIDEGTIKFIPERSIYYSLLKITRCDQNGNFLFKDLPEGEYFIIADIVLNSPLEGSLFRKAGGSIMKKVKLKDGEIKEVVLKYQLR